MLDTGHYLHTNLDLHDQDAAVACLHQMLDNHKDLIPYIKGIHLQESLTGEYVKQWLADAPHKLPEDPAESFRVVYEHIFQLDRHEPFTAAGVKGLVERIDPLYVTYEYITRSREELAEYLTKAGYQVTQATVSRDIRELKLSKVQAESGKQRYVVFQSQEGLSDKYIRILRDGFLSMDMAQNILVIKTVSGMAMAVAAALDAIHFHEIVGCIAGDDTIMCAVRSVDDTILVMDKLRSQVDDTNQTSNMEEQVCCLICR